jgi:hypothetical protein
MKDRRRYKNRNISKRLEREKKHWGEGVGREVIHE